MVEDDIRRREMEELRFIIIVSTSPLWWTIGFASLGIACEAHGISRWMENLVLLGSTAMEGIILVLWFIRLTW